MFDISILSCSECDTCGREGCSGDCDWSGPPEGDSGGSSWWDNDEESSEY